MSKIEVNGPNAHPVYSWLRMNSELYDKGSQKGQQIPWNFSKFLVDRSGNLVKYYAQKPLPLEFEEDIQPLLK